jgi:uncharacterized protein YjbJ (UPF0337 family)
MLRLIVGGLVGAAIAYFLDPDLGQRRRNMALSYFDREGMMMDGKMDRVRGRIRSTWSTVTDDDIERARGNLEVLAGTIKERTGENIESIRDRLQTYWHDRY